MIPLVLPPLNGLHVLVTRPEEQGKTLSAQLQAAGAEVTCWPALQIQPLHYEAPQQTFDLLIFVSANAVQHGQAILHAQPQARLAAVGQATAHALTALGHTLDAVPTDGSDSEALLNHPLLHSPPKQVLIVRGRGGRDVLRETLMVRGATVAVAETYTRGPITPEPRTLQALQQALHAATVDVITVTSVDLLHALYRQLGDVLLQPTVTLLAGSTRIAQAARELGHQGEYVTARSPQDAHLLDALSNWHTRQRGLKLLR